MRHWSTNKKGVSGAFNEKEFMQQSEFRTIDCTVNCFGGISNNVVVRHINCPMDSGRLKRYIHNDAV
jgi:hypothetical protein